jgi:hypothetical protein
MGEPAMTTHIETLGDAFPREIARVRTIHGYYVEIGAPGQFGAMWIGELLQQAEKAWAEQDTVAMVKLYPELQGVTE